MECALPSSIFSFLMIRRPPRSTLSLHDALPIFATTRCRTTSRRSMASVRKGCPPARRQRARRRSASCRRSEEHTSELQSQSNLVCRLLLEKKKKQHIEEAIVMQILHHSVTTAE